MTLNKKIMTILTLVMAVGVIGTAYAYHTSFFGLDCDGFVQTSLHQTCNDLNNLNDRVTEIENGNFPEIYSKSEQLTCAPMSECGVVISCIDDLVINSGWRVDNTGNNRDKLFVFNNNESTGNRLFDSWTFGLTNTSDESISTTLSVVCLDITP